MMQILYVSEPYDQIIAAGTIGIIKSKNDLNKWTCVSFNVLCDSSPDMCCFTVKGTTCHSEQSQGRPIIRHSGIIYSFWGLIGFCYFQVFTIDWTRSYCREIVINCLNTDFFMTYYV